MSELLTPEGSLALAIAVLQLALGYRFTLPERGRDLGGLLTYAVAVVLALAAGRGLVAGSLLLKASLVVRVAGAVLLVTGLYLAGASSRARLVGGRGRLVTNGPYSLVRHPLYVGLSLVLAGGLLRAPSLLGAFATAIAIAHYAWLGTLEEQDARRTFGPGWQEYEARDPRSGSIPATVLTQGRSHHIVTEEVTMRRPAASSEDVGHSSDRRPHSRRNVMVPATADPGPRLDAARLMPGIPANPRFLAPSFNRHGGCRWRDTGTQDQMEGRNYK